jgi:hypothetical protein
MKPFVVMQDAGKSNWIQTRQSLKIECLYFICSLRSNASAEYSAWRNYLDRCKSEMDTNNIISNSEILVMP